MVFDNKQLNNTNLGNFGEFIYRGYLEKLNFEVEQVNTQETDVRLKKLNKVYLVDVKSTRSLKGIYNGKRSKNNVIYERVLILNDIAIIFPDKTSPLYNFNQSIIIKNINKKFNDFRKANREKRNIANRNNAHKSYWDNKMKIIENLFYKKKYKVRARYRGTSNLKGWSDKPDNIPGKEKVINKFDATIFIQLKDNKNMDAIKKIYFIPHKLLGIKIALAQPTQRQIKNGFDKILDWGDFNNHNKDLIFNSFKNFKDNASTLIKKYK